MSRGGLFAFLTGVMLAAPVAARIDVAPAPREIRPDGSRDPAPQAANPKKENPLEVVERIIKNSKAVGDKLAMTDTGTETRGTQTKILKDIESLIDQQENPPPQSDQDQQKNQDSAKDKKNDSKPMGGMNDKPMNKDSKKDMNKDMGGMGEPPMKKDMDMGASEDQPHTRRPRHQDAQEPMSRQGQPKNQSANKQPQQTRQPPRDPKTTGGRVPDPSRGNPTDPGKPSLPLEDEIVKEVWGHLPDKMRQQATQYYQQDFMPRYTELLKLYYASLAEKSERK